MYTIPLDFVLSRNPSGKISDDSKPLGSGLRSTQRKCCPLLSRPTASSRICLTGSLATLPKQTYNTEESAWLFNHFNESPLSGFPWILSRKVVSPSPKPSRSGPIVNILDTYNSGNHQRISSFRHNLLHILNLHSQFYN